MAKFGAAFGHCTSENGREYAAFGISIISDRNLQAIHYDVVVWGKRGRFAEPLQKGTRVKLVIQAQVSA